MTEAQKPRTKEELLDQIESEWKALMETVAHIPAEKMERPDAGGWSPKDNLAHLTEWMKILMNYHMDKLPAHEAAELPPEATAGWDWEVINPLLFERNREKPLEQVLSEMHAVYTRLTAKLRGMSFEDLMAPRHPDAPEKGPLLDWILGDTTEHFQEHRETIERSVGG